MTVTGISPQSIVAVTVAANRKNHHLKNDQAGFMTVTGIPPQLIEGMLFATNPRKFRTTDRKFAYDHDGFPWYRLRFWPGEYLRM